MGEGEGEVVVAEDVDGAVLDGGALGAVAALLDRGVEFVVGVADVADVAFGDDLGCAGPDGGVVVWAGGVLRFGLGKVFAVC